MKAFNDSAVAFMRVNVILNRMIVARVVVHRGRGDIGGYVDRAAQQCAGVGTENDVRRGAHAVIVLCRSDPVSKTLRILCSRPRHLQITLGEDIE